MHRAMNMLSEHTAYLERAIEFERAASESKDTQSKHKLLVQASVYRKLAAKTAAELGLSKPPQSAPPPQSN
jgi:hypothetical protein